MFTPNFTLLVKLLKNFKIIESIRDERELETKLESYLSYFDGIKVIRQKSVTKRIRNDLVCIVNDSKICLELKKNADISIAQQIDKYLPYYRDGVIIVCWKCSESLRQVVKTTQEQIKIPLELIEIRRYQNLF